jgi:GR25 family glycosyltransferase involved in LPS biosynthesis
MNYAGFYINLNRRPKRNVEMEAEIARYGLLANYKRFSAADGNVLKAPNPHLKEGEIGCFTSHMQLLKQNLESRIPLHVIEDDVIFSTCTAQAIKWAIEQGQLDNYDIIYTDIFVPLLNDAYKAYKKVYDTVVQRDAKGNITSTSFSVVDLKGLIFGSTTSFLVNKNAIKKLHDLFATEIARGATLPVDLFIRKLCCDGAIKVGCIFPFVTSVRLDHILETDIVRNHHNLSPLAAHLARYSFFIGADFAKCREYLDKFLPLPTSDKHAQILSHLLAFSLTDNYKAP